MVIIESVLGNFSDPEWARRLAAARLDVLALDQWEAQKNRFRKRTAGGTEVAVSLDRGVFLHDGDVLAWDTQALMAVVVRVTLRDVLVIHLDGLKGLAPELAMRTCVELGHALGNQHWPALVKEGVVYVPLTVDRKQRLDVAFGGGAMRRDERNAVTAGGLVQRGAREFVQRGLVFHHTSLHGRFETTRKRKAADREHRVPELKEPCYSTGLVRSARHR